tara:strand:- start:238 stop:804 length:567 start_codon:yes stop_codon:yes gene_type:complete
MSAGNGKKKMGKLKGYQCFTRANKSGGVYTTCKDDEQQLRIASAKKKRELTKPKQKKLIVKGKPKPKPKPKPSPKPKRPRGRPKLPPKVKSPPKKLGRKVGGETKSKSPKIRGKITEKALKKQLEGLKGKERQAKRRKILRNFEIEPKPNPETLPPMGVEGEQTAREKGRRPKYRRTGPRDLEIINYD